jgi:tRNA G18 (ribose-2'-O)-methylase SpoU
MGIERIDSANDPRVARYGGVRDGELMRSAGLFVAEGRHIVRRIVERGGYHLQSLLLNDAAFHDLEGMIGRLGPDVPVFVSGGEVLAAIAGYDVHRGCLALAHRPPRIPIDVVVAAATVLVVLEGVSNADNIGSIFRNAAAFEAGGVLLSPACCDPLYRKAIRTSMGATLGVRFAYADAGDWPRVLSRVKSAGFTIVALTPRAPSETLDAFSRRPRPARIALIAGTEGAGLTPEVEVAADYRVRIPISDSVDSLNVAVAVGIALHALRM